MVEIARTSQLSQIDKTSLMTVRAEIEALQTLEIVYIDEFAPAFRRLQNAHLALSTNNTLKPYGSATIYTQSVRKNDVIPCSFYALIPRLFFQSAFRKRLRRENIDLFNLPGIVYYRVNGILLALIPPIIERYTETHPLYGGQEITVLQDGLHRTILADYLGQPQLSIMIEGATEEVLPHAIPNSWGQVRYYFEVPPVKKVYRKPHPHEYIDVRPFRALLRKFEGREVGWGDLARNTSTYQPSNT